MNQTFHSCSQAVRAFSGDKVICIRGNRSSKNTASDMTYLFSHKALLLLHHSFSMCCKWMRKWLQWFLFSDAVHFLHLLQSHCHAYYVIIVFLVQTKPLCFSFLFAIKLLVISRTRIISRDYSCLLTSIVFRYKVLVYAYLSAPVNIYILNKHHLFSEKISAQTIET